MLVFPLGLGTRLRRAPLVTLGVALVWLLVAAVDRSEEQVLERLFNAVGQRGVKDSARNLFVQYCVKHHGDAKKCRKYAVLVWTGFPSKTQRARPPHDVDYLALAGEGDKAKAVREELSDCRHSKKCFAYKDIIWHFQEASRGSPVPLAGLSGYKEYEKSLAAYRKDLRRICAQHACLVKGNINGPSLVMSQVRHGGMLHLLSNMAALLIFGIYVEQRTSRLLYLGVLLAGGTIGMALHAAVFGSGDTVALGGSANVSAAMGMFYVFFFHRKMRFQVWLPRKLYLGTPYFADVKYAFPLLFVLSDVAGGLDNGFADLVSAKVAHFAHLGGLFFGMAAALLIVAAQRLPKPFLYAEEPRDLAKLEQQRDLGQLLAGARRILRYNPDNVHAMEVGCGAFLRWSHVARVNEHAALFDRGRVFLQEHLQAVCAINARSGHLRYACKLLSSVPMYMPYKAYLGRLGQVSTLRLGDYALGEGHPMLALRLYDFFLSRYTLSVKTPAVEESAASILAALSPSAENLAALRAFVQFHPDSLLAPRVGAWITNATEARTA